MAQEPVSPQGMTAEQAEEILDLLSDLLELADANNQLFSQIFRYILLITFILMIYCGFDIGMKLHKRD